MTLSRWRRIVTGVAAGVIVLCGALIGASFRDDNGGVSVASELRPANVIQIEEDPVDNGDTGDQVDTADEADSTEDDALTEPVQVIETDDVAEADDSGDASDSAEAGDSGDAPEAGDDAGDTAADDTTTDAAPDATDGDAATGAETDDDATVEDPAAGQTADDSTDDDTSADDDSTDDDTSADDSSTEGTAAGDQAAPAAPLTATDDALGTGGGVDDAECALDRLVIYAGARVGGVAGSIRNALAQAGFGASCPTPVTVLASNCPLQFAGVLGGGSGYDPAKSYVASSASVDRETMTAVMGTVGYTGNQIDILDFSFVNADRPGEQWIAIFVPPSFDGWQGLAGRAGLSPTTSSLCAPSGELAG